MKKILAFTLVLILCLTSLASVSISAEEYDLLNSGVYRDKVEPFIMKRSGNNLTFLYYEIYYHYETPTTSTEDAPDYVLAFACDGSAHLIEPFERIGDYVVCQSAAYYPYELGFVVYVPSEDALYSLAEAYNRQIEGIEQAFLNLGNYCALLGDADGNGKLDIKDATMIQKRLAGMDVQQEGKVSFSNSYALDFDGDGVCTIKDATAIQKRLVGLPY